MSKGIDETRRMFLKAATAFSIGIAVVSLPGLAIGAEPVSKLVSKELPMAEPNREQIDLNYKSFQEKLPELIRDHPGKFALMHDGNIVAFFDTASDAYTAGAKIFGEKDQSFSIQEIISGPVNLGFFSYAVP